MNRFFALTLVLLLVGCERERRADAVESGPAPVEFREEFTRPPGLKSTPPRFTCTREAQAAQVSGIVIADCVVTVEGDLRDCHIAKSNPLLDAMVLDMLPRWNVGPLTFEGKPVATRYKIPVRVVCGPPVEAEPEADATKREVESYYGALSAAARRHFDASGIPEPERAGLTADVVIRIDENGKLLDARVTKPSGNATFDAQVLAAMRSADPFEPPPRAIAASLRDSGVTVRFKP